MTTQELKDNLKNGTKNDGSTTTVENQSTEEINKLKGDLEKSEKEKQEALQKAADIQFNSDFNAATSIYPYASDFKDAIKEKTKLGLTVDEATIIVLTKEKKLQTADEIKAKENRGEGVGGSSSTIRAPKDDKNKPKDLKQLEQDFKDAEARGEIIFK